MHETWSRVSTGVCIARNSHCERSQGKPNARLRERKSSSLCKVATKGQLAHLHLDYSYPSACKSIKGPPSHRQTPYAVCSANTGVKESRKDSFPKGCNQVISNLVIYTPNAILIRAESFLRTVQGSADFIPKSC